MAKYTEEFTKELIEGYQAQNGNYEAEQAFIVEKAKFTGHTIAGVRQKLVREKVYNAKAKTATEKNVRKAELVTQLAQLANVNEEVFETFEKANRKPLEILVGRFRAAVETVE